MKRLIPCIYLYQGNAVKGFHEFDIIDTDPIKLAKYFSENRADELIIYDLSTTDSEHEIAIDFIKQICEATEIPVIGAGNVHRMEDIKKLLYAGCKKAVLNYSKENNIALTEEVSKKFGKEKLIAAIFDPMELVNYADILEEYVSEILLINNTAVKEANQISNLPMIATLPEISLDKLIEILKLPHIYGVTGELVNENAKEYEALKLLCEENGIPMKEEPVAFSWEEFKKNSDGMVPVIVQDYKTDETLMLAYMNEEAFNKTMETGKMTYFSRSRNELWIKGDTSGHYQYVKSLIADCDMDTILAKVSQVGAACHTGKYSCFFNTIYESEKEDEKNPLHILQNVYSVIEDRKVHPKEGSYTNYLFDKGIDKILKKLGEEATEIVIASKNPNPNEIKYEISDFLYHMMVLMVEKGVTWEEITTELANR